MVERVYTLIGLTVTVIAFLWIWYECYFKPKKLKRELLALQNHMNTGGQQQEQQQHQHQQQQQQQQFPSIAHISRRPAGGISSSSNQTVVERDLPPSYSISVSSSNPPMYSDAPIYSIEKDLPPSYYDATIGHHHQNDGKDNAKCDDERSNPRRSNSGWLHVRRLLTRSSTEEGNSALRPR